METETCNVLVPDGGRMVTSHRCGRAAKERGLCGIHLAAEQRRAQRDAEYRDRRAEQDRLRDQAEADCARLAAHGITATPHYVTAYTGRNPGYDGRVAVVTSADALLEWRLAGGGQ